ncbi:hypothetical protein L810_4214 [Burkholderia sp. AU4i]|nr:hypothetical protein L810_4214 [Burkholderia sp. AU4i]MDW9245374.1 putative outer membrane autotransporter barrel domain protein [Burkholderia cepacia]
MGGAQACAGWAARPLAARPRRFRNRDPAAGGLAPYRSK